MQKTLAEIKIILNEVKSTMKNKIAAAPPPPMILLMYSINVIFFGYCIDFGPIKPMTPFLPDGNCSPETIME